MAQSPDAGQLRLISEWAPPEACQRSRRRHYLASATADLVNSRRPDQTSSLPARMRLRGECAALSMHSNAPARFKVCSRRPGQPGSGRITLCSFCA